MVWWNVLFRKLESLRFSVNQGLKNTDCFIWSATFLTMWNPPAAPWQLCYGSTSWVARRGAYAGASVKSENGPDLKLTQDRTESNDCWVALPPVAFEFFPISCCLPLLSDTQLFLLVGLQRKGAWAHWCPTQIGPSLKTGHSRGLQSCWLPQHYLFLRGFSYVPSCALVAVNQLKSLSSLSLLSSTED